MLKSAKHHLAFAPTPMAGLALGIASLGWSWENMSAMSGIGQTLGAVIAAPLLLLLLAKFLCHPRVLLQDLAHPVVGSVVPTFAMALMVVSNSISKLNHDVGAGVWLFAVTIHVIFLMAFIAHRAKRFHLSDMVPSWFVPPVGLIVADVSFAGGALRPVAEAVLYFGLISYALMLPMMLYRLIFRDQVPDAAKPTIAILAAPASLSLAGYLTVETVPSPLVIGLLAGIAVLMTVVIYLAMVHLLRLPFSPAYAAFTFPLVISATALFKTCVWLASVGVAPHYIAQLRGLAELELWVATVVVSYVAYRYVLHYRPLSRGWRHIQSHRQLKQI
ncbi:hypothetical protein VST7929_02186 [Vibrio stylophorae]|uniref:C4-dicarboxylate ABC transporter n=1 Tax=Vibrio stylophorae TaxID=659351 RepID=A0ABM8ZW84_9VIBR|nr:TDT family transporter [Vibrio stylophorae]CAH0534270.1 hypothetical protein VST7929_02186 [Vibrio stylophorae]